MQFSKNKNIIAAVKNEETLQLALESNVETIFVLSGDICKINGLHYFTSTSPSLSVL